MASTLHTLFPTPSPPPSVLAPARLPGITPETTATLKKVLKDNHERWHIFFNDLGYHNHAAHRALAVWAMGGDGSLIEAGYKVDSDYLKPAYPSPSAITAENFNDHLTKFEYYDAYLKFFIHEIGTLGMAAVLEKYIFSREYNFDETLPDEKQPRMLNRFISGLLHPLIHVGYGFEFGLPGIAAEGFAQTALHKAMALRMITPSVFDKHSVQGGDSASSALAKELDITAPSKPAVGNKGTHALTIVARLLKDPRLAEAKYFKEENFVFETEKKFGDIIQDYLEQWDADTSDPKEVERKYEELVWTVVVIYGIGGWEEGKDFNADFFFMHLVTSSLFLPSLLPFLSPPSQALLLRAYFAVVLRCWVGRGRPAFKFKGFFSQNAYPLPSGSLPTPDKSTLPSADVDPNRVKTLTPNPWLPIVETTLGHPGEHLIKLQRALAHFSSLYGTRQPDEGGLEGAKEELEGAELLDGTLFIRVAGVTAKRLGRVREGEPEGSFDQIGFYAQ
ncbi:hypothetical protein AX17_007483 [Amanita inopinata Kibby_2008]|nr:hypothetical protein AX17_007483 [Amanita inopinata Kibby_2008]